MKLMNIPIKTLWLAIHRVFSLQGIGMGCSLALKEVMEAWPESGLRQADLARGLESLTRAGFVRLEMSPEGPAVKLLDEQFGFLRQNSEDQQALNTLAKLRDARKRPMGHLSSLLGRKDDRRAEDRPKPMAFAA